MSVTSLGCKTEMGTSGQRIRKCLVGMWTWHIGDNPLFSPISCSGLTLSPTFHFPTYFNFSFLFLWSGCLSLSFPTLPPTLTSPSWFPEQSCLSGCLYQALPSRPRGKAAAFLPLEQNSCLGSRIPSQSQLFPHFPKPCLSVSTPSLQGQAHQVQGRAHQVQGVWAISSGGLQSLWDRGLWDLLKALCAFWEAAGAVQLHSNLDNGILLPETLPNSTAATALTRERRLCSSSATLQQVTAFLLGEQPSSETLHGERHYILPAYGRIQVSWGCSLVH